MEIVALSYSVIKWFSALPVAAYPHQILGKQVGKDVSKGVVDADQNHGEKYDEMNVDGAADADAASTIRLADWASLIERNFERNFWIPSDEAAEGRTGFYKDTVGEISCPPSSSSSPSSSFSPSFPILD